MTIKRKVAIFGAQENAEMAAYYFQRDRSDIAVVAFVEDNPTQQTLLSIPILAESEFLEVCPPSDVSAFTPYVAGRARQKKQRQLEALGYEFETYVSPNATVWEVRAIGKNCFIQEGNNIQYGTYIGDGCSFWATNHIGHHGTIDPFVTFTSHVVLSGRCHVGSGSYFGVNSTVRDGIVIGEDIFVGQGANVTKSLTDPGVYLGNPAVKTKSKI